MSTTIESIDIINTKENLIILDWDDTILPSSWLVKNNLSVDNIIFEDFTEDLFIYENCVIEFFTQLMKNGKIIIITNAEKGWVELSCEKFLPKILPLLSKIKIVSAKSSYITISYSPFIWKELAFRVQIDVYIKNNPNIVKNIISIGDAAYEREALLKVSKDIKNLAPTNYIKSIKFNESPDIFLLIQQLDIVSSNIKQIIDEKSSLDLMLIQKPIEEIDSNLIFNPETNNLKN
jgi:hypothetical protein